MRSSPETARLAEPAMPFAFMTLTVVSEGRGASLFFADLGVQRAEPGACAAATSGCWKSWTAAAMAPSFG